MRYLEYDRHTSLLLVVFQIPHKCLPTWAKDDEGDNDVKHKNALDTGKELLHPMAMAQMIQQIFWSLRQGSFFAVYHVDQYTN